MHNSSTFDLNLKEAIRRLQVKETNHLYNEVQKQPHTFSKKFERKMNWALANSGKSYFTIINTAAKRVAVIAITVFTLLTITTFSVDALREPVVEFITKVFQKFTSIVFQIDEEAEPLPTTIEAEHFPTYIPEGYMLSEQVDFEGFVQIIYTHETEYNIIFEQRIIAAADMVVDTEDVTMEDISIGEHEGKYFFNKGFQNLIWTDGSYSYYLQGPVEKEQLIQVASSVK